MVSYLPSHAQATWDQQRWPQTQSGYGMMPSPVSYTHSTSMASTPDIRSYAPQLPSGNGQLHNMMPASYHGAQFDTRPHAYQPAVQFNANPYHGHAPVSFDSLRSGFEPRQPVRNSSPIDSASSVSSYGHHWSSSVHSSPRSTAFAVPPHEIPLKREIKDVTPIISKNPEDTPRYNTGVDRLMRSIQTLKMRSELSTPATSPASDGTAPSSPPDRLKMAKPFACDADGCGQSFGQKSHLKQHKKTHDGTKEYICKYCGKACTQKENLADHIRAHENRRDHLCRQPGCGKSFTSRGTLNNHKKTHMVHRERYECRLEACGKTFATPGNLKQHQCKFHETELIRITNLLNSCADFENLDHLSPTDAELVKDMARLHKNSNKGIKGRGKGNKVNHQNDAKCKCDPLNAYSRPCAVHGHEAQRCFDSAYYPARM